MSLSCQIRAYYTDTHIRVYQAYSLDIAEAAVRDQRLDASKAFSIDRMSWIKPSWSWMMYRSGYSYKDPRQARILALDISHANFIKILEQADVNEVYKHPNERQGPDKTKRSPVRIQWDPERDIFINKISAGTRSVQIGLGRSVLATVVAEMIDSIMDVTDQARQTKQIIDDERQAGSSEKEIETKLVSLNLVPVEKEYSDFIPEELRSKLMFTM